MNITHDWVNHFEEYEAVLVCTNELPVWEGSQVMRAFAIDQWSDATTKDDTPSLKHNDFGTIIRHDGGVLAIDFGHGSLNDSLPDLFLALHRLGWRGAVVYHPAMSINELLTDIGRAIPANLEFDVQAAGQKYAIAESAEGQMLVESVNRLSDVDTPIHHDIAYDSQVIINTFRELGEPVENHQENDFAENFAHVDYIEPAAAVEVPLDVADATAIDDYAPVPYAFDDTPNIYVGEHGEDSEDVSLLAEASEVVLSEFIVSRDETDPAHDVMAVDLSEREMQNNIISPLVPLDMTKLNSLNNIKVGHSVFCFDVPGQALNDESIKRIASEYNINSSNVVNLYPGAINAPVRWNLLGEVDLNFPWLVENLVNLMMPNTDINLVSSIFLAVIKNKPSSDLRDILMFVDKDVEEISRMLTAVSPAAALLLKQAKRRGSLDSTLDQIVQCLGRLALNDESFVDVEHAIDTANTYRAFTVLEVLTSPLAELFIVHVDALDSPFVNTLVNSLHYVATKSSESVRYSIGEFVVAPVIDEGEMKRKADAQVLISSLVEQLQVLGIDFSSISK